MFYVIIGIVIFLVVLWVAEETPEDRRAVEEYHRKKIREEMDFAKSEAGRRAREWKEQWPRPRL